MTSDKKSVALLADIFVKKGLEHIVISPGSRNAPIIIAFANNPKIKALSIFDERSAAFFALGIAQQTGKTVAIACTSGTAALNYAPAIAEAYYQKIPLLVLTADRPAEFVDQGDGQTIRQKNIYRNYIKAGFEIQEDFDKNNTRSEAEIQINEAINQTMYPSAVPVPINLPFSEPVYNQVEKIKNELTIVEPKPEEKIIEANELNPFIEVWNKADKKLLTAGLMNPNP
ncbi:MAG: hypothetical protein K8S18_01440, partial [Desulfobacula sp.]|nr:hypothetical protein [Desulfobacula sp.]